MPRFCVSASRLVEHVCEVVVDAADVSEASRIAHEGLGTAAWCVTGVVMSPVIESVEEVAGPVPDMLGEFSQSYA